MFRITEDPSSGSLVQCLVKDYDSDSIVSVDMEKVGVMSSYSDLLCVCVLWQRILTVISGRISCHNTGLVHVNGRDRIILVIFSQTLYRAP